MMSVRDWLKVVNSAVRNPQPEAEFEARLAAIDFACRTLGPEAWNTATLGTAVRKFQFFPSAADVYELLAEHYRSSLPAHVRMGGSTPIGKAMERLAGPVEPRHTPEEVEAVKQTVAELKAELAASRKPDSERGHVTPRYVDRVTLARSVSPKVLATRPDLRSALEMTQASS